MDSSALRLDWLRSFLAFAETGSFTAAAGRLHLSQPALHTQVRHLGDAIGRPLYSRVGRRLVLTPTGRDVEALARDVLGRIDRLARQLGGADEVPPVISAGRATHLYVLAGALRAWDRPLSLRTEDRQTALDSVRSGRADLALVPNVEREAGLVATPLLEIGQVVILPLGDSLVDRRALRLGELRDRPMILPPAGRPHREAVVAALGAPPRVLIEVDGWELMAHYAALGVGVAIVNASIPVPQGMVAVPVSDLPRQRFSLIHRREARPAPVDALANHLIQILRPRESAD